MNTTILANKNLDKIIKTLPSNKYMQLYEFALFLSWQTKNKNDNSSYKYIYQANDEKVEEQFNIPAFVCNGMVENFNRADLYETRI